MIPTAALLSCVLATAGGDLDALLERFHGGPTLAERRAVAREIVDSGAEFSAVLAGLRRGRTYAADVPRGRLLFERTGINGLRHPWMVLVPEDYTPERRWPVRLDLHGGMGAPEWKELNGAWSPGWSETYHQIVVVPAGWWDSMWWEHAQVENFEAILAEVRATWNIDEDRVVVYGASDGGAALFFHAARAPDRYAGYAGHVAPPDRLTRADFRPDGQVHLSNLAGQTFHLGFGERDRKVPLRYIERYMELFTAAGAQIDWYVLAGQGHGLTLPRERERELWRFLMDSVRDPLPARLSWATERCDRYARRQWLVIDALAEGHEVERDNLLPRLGTSLQLRGPTVEARPWGRVELEREGNHVRARTRGVAAFTLLFSPDAFDLERPITVEVDGEVRHQGRIEPSLETLLQWAAVDGDRRRLFAAQLTLRP